MTLRDDAKFRLSPALSATGYFSLPELENAIRRDLEILEYPSKRWLRPIKRDDGLKVYDVVVVGGGHCGLAAAFGLLREKISDILVLDENPPGQEGPWQTYARMPDLRTRKTVTGMELGYPNLTFRCYFEARKGAAAYFDLKRITCEEWTGYLLWLRRVLDIPVQNHTRVEAVERDGNLFRLTARREDDKSAVYARRVVLASGPLSTGGPNIPDAIKRDLPRSAYKHVYETFDRSQFKGKRVLVIGGGASGFDNAGAALEEGASDVRLLMRRPKIPRLSLIRWTDWSGFLNGYADLDDLQKWRLMAQVQRNPAPPPIRALNRVEKQPNFHPCFGAPILGASMSGDTIVLETPEDKVIGDLVLLATGFSVDLRACGPLSSFVDDIALWSDRFTPPAGTGSAKFENAPYLGRHYEFLEKEPGRAPWLKHIFNFTQSATLSMGPTGRVSGLKYGVRRLMLGISNSLLREDFENHYASIQAYNESELDGHPWAEDAPDGG